MNDQCALFGHPVAHSRAPHIYRAFSRQTGQPCQYRLIDCPPGELPAALAAFAATPGAVGANVTVPLKLASFALCNATSERARLAGAVNLLRVDARAWLFGDNTDGAGLVRDLRHNLGVALQGARILVVGAGGAARGILGPLADCDPGALVVANRDGAKADALAARFAAHGVHAAPFGNPGTGFDVVINATSASLHHEVPAIPASVFAPQGVAYDLAYRDDGSTDFTRWAAAHGSVSVHDGWGMLVEQAAESWEVWFGTRPDTTAVRDAAFRAGAAGPPGGD